MYNAIRKIHLYCGLVVLVFLMMYFVSGYVMIHRPWFGGQSNKPPANGRIARRLHGPRTPEALAAYIVSDSTPRPRNIPPPRQPQKSIRFNVFRPARSTRWKSRTTATRSRSPRRENIAGVLVQLHRVHGYGGGPVWNAFVFFNDLASASCIVFALTGVYLWWKTAKRKIWGVLCLTASCAYTIGTILYLMYAR